MNRQALVFLFLMTASLEVNVLAQTPEATSLRGQPLFSAPITGAAGARLQENLARATADFIKNPDDADNIIWLGRRLAYLGRFREAIDVFSRGIRLHPNDHRMYRHRGHRYITVRELDRAIADFDRATQLIRGKPDAVEPDGAPNARNIPTSTSHFNIWYHLGLAHYLKGDFEKARTAFQECMKFSTNSNDRLVATSDWLYMIVRRLNRPEEAKKLLEPIQLGMDIIENQVYYERLLMYKGLKKPEDLLAVDSTDNVQIATYGYGIANWYLYNGQKDRAVELFNKVLAGTGWPAFGFIAAEAEMARMR